MKTRFWQCCLLLALALSGAAAQRARVVSKYERPAHNGGLFYAVSSADKNEHHALVLSYNDQPIEPKANDPSAPTVPGFYPAGKERYAFARVEVIGRRVYFKTRRVGRISYEFTGRSGAETAPDFDPSIRVPFIAGTLTKLKDGRVVAKEKIRFGHAVIA